MAKTRKRETLIINVTPQEAQEAMLLYANAYSKLKEISAKMEQKFQKIRDENAEDNIEYNKVINENFRILQKYAEIHRDEFEEKKSKDIGNGKIGFRTSPPKVSGVKGFTFKACAQLLKENGKEDYLRVEVGVNKEKLIADRYTEAGLAALKVGKMTIEHEETFFVEVKEENMDTVKK